ESMIASVSPRSRAWRANCWENVGSTSTSSPSLTGATAMLSCGDVCVTAVRPSRYTGSAVPSTRTAPRRACHQQVRQARARASRMNERSVRYDLRCGSIPRTVPSTRFKGERMRAHTSLHPRLGGAAALSALALVLTACAGSAGGSTPGSEAGDGCDYAASDEEVAAALEDLEPVTITYQVPATSQDSPQAPLGTEFKEAVEERSGGKITVDLAWNQSIATYDEIHDALADGRVDM